MAFAASRDRFLTFPPKSPIIPYPIPTASSYSHGTHMVITCSSSNFFEKSKMKENERGKFFCYVFYNGKKNGSGIFCSKKPENILLYYFDTRCEFDGYLFFTVLIITNITAANNKRVSIIASIVLNTKNFFNTLQKMRILDDLLIQKLEYLVVFMMILLLLIDIKQFLLYYDYIYIYQLYMDMVSFYFYNMQSLYKKMKNIYNSNTKFLKNIETSRFGIITRRETSDAMIIITRKRGGMFAYFLKFFKPCWVSCGFVFLLFR